ncbi:MAG: DoxX family protein [Paracoccaceae bacterium]|nr:DoxX family protein [Paracoccaceae bacterium]MDG1739705.1 DoxX family protein [Paracoccaceae bacterium]MDG2258725.1 DoxX family protein [Paracoccaceae bacterium]
MKRYLTLGIKAFLTLAFLAAGGAKLAGAEMMVQTFDAVGLGQWFRYVTGAIEVAGAILLWVPSAIGLAAGLLTATMVGAVLAHTFILGPSAVPAVFLGVLSGYIAWTNRKDIPMIGTGLSA